MDNKTPEQASAHVWLSRCEGLTRELAGLEYAKHRMIALYKNVRPRRRSAAYTQYIGTLDGYIEKLCSIRNEAAAVINSVKDEREQELLTMRYLDGKTWNQIAEAMHYSNRTILRLYKKALNSVYVIIKGAGIPPP